MHTLPEMVTTRMPKAMTFIIRLLLSIDPKDVRKLAMVIDMKARLLTFARRSVTEYILVERSTGSFIATASSVKEVALREKYLDGNQYFLLRSPCKTSAAMASVQMVDAAAAYMPIHSIGASSCLSTLGSSAGIAKYGQENRDQSISKVEMEF